MRNYSLLIITIIAVLLIIRLYPEVNSLVSIDDSRTEAELSAEAAGILEDLGYDTGDHRVEVSVRQNSRLLEYLQEKYDIDSANSLITKGVPAYTYEISFMSGKSAGINEEGQFSVNSPEMSIETDFKGAVTGLDIEMPDSLNSHALTRTGALDLAYSFMNKYARVNDLSIDSNGSKQNGEKLSLELSIGNTTGVKAERKKIPEESGNTGYKFEFTGRDSVTGLETGYTLALEGEHITSFKTEYTMPDEYAKDQKSGILEIMKVSIYAVMIIFMFIVALKKYRAFEIGFRNALIISGLSGLASFFDIYFQLGAHFEMEMLLPLIFGPLFIAFGIFLVWAVAEADIREYNNSRMKGLDYLLNGFFTNSYFSRSILTGITAGLAVFALYYLIIFIADRFLEVSYVFLPVNKLTYLNSGAPVLTVFSTVYYALIFETAIFFLFLYSELRKRISSIYPVLVILPVLLAFVDGSPLSPWIIGYPLQVLIFAFFVYLLYKSDFTALFTALFVFSVSDSVLFFFYNSNFSFSLYVTVILTALILILLIYGLFTKDRNPDLYKITPSFVHHISERKRLQNELDVAKQVQTSFLPLNDPIVEGFDVAGRCIPAYEVGGDYYDFIEYGDSKTGIIIGDVSGKGTRAAFYMTLTKGFLKALSKSFISPVEILVRMNDLFCENVKKGHFISMVVGVLDSAKSELKYARAGHNPAYFIRSGSDKIETINSAGMALGLEKGELFRKNIEEITIGFERGDMLLLYTDGFIESANKKNEQFGETRLKNLIRENQELPAGDIISKIYNEIKGFIGKSEQKDDMTIVVIKKT